MEKVDEVHDCGLGGDEMRGLFGGEQEVVECFGRLSKRVYLAVFETEV